MYCDESSIAARQYVCAQHTHIGIHTHMSQTSAHRKAAPAATCLHFMRVCIYSTCICTHTHKQMHTHTNIHMHSSHKEANVCRNSTVPRGTSLYMYTYTHTYMCRPQAPPSRRLNACRETSLRNCALRKPAQRLLCVLDIHTSRGSGHHVGCCRYSHIVRFGLEPIS